MSSACARAITEVTWRVSGKTRSCRTSRSTCRLSTVGRRSASRKPAHSRYLISIVIGGTRVHRAGVAQLILCRDRARGCLVIVNGIDRIGSGKCGPTSSSDDSPCGADTGQASAKLPLSFSSLDGVDCDVARPEGVREGLRDLEVWYRKKSIRHRTRTRSNVESTAG